MIDQVQSQKEIHPNSKPFFSIIPLVDEVKSKISHQNSINKVAKMQKSTSNDPISQQFQKENLSPPKKYKFNDQKQSKFDAKIQEDQNSSSLPKEERKQILKKIIFSAKSSNYLQKPTINDNDQTTRSKKSETEEKVDKIKRYNSDFPAQKKATNNDLQKSDKNDNKYCPIPNSISDSRISEKDTQKNSRKIVFLIKASSHMPNDDLIEQDLQESNKNDSIIKNSKSDFPKKFNFGNSPAKESDKKAKITRKSIQTAKSSNNLQNQGLIGPKQKISEADNVKSDKIKKSNSDFPTPKKLKSESSLNKANKEIKNQQDSELKTAKKGVSSTKSSNTLQDQANTKLSSKPSESKVDKIKKFNSDFPTPKKLDINESDHNDQNKNKESSNKDKENSKKIPRKVIESTKSSYTLQKLNKSDQKSSPKTDESKSDKIKTSNSDFPAQKKLESETKGSKDKENINKIPRMPIASTKSSNSVQNQNKIGQGPSPKAEELKTDKIEKFNSDFPTQKKLDIDEEQKPDQSKNKERSVKDQENANKNPRKLLTSTKSSNNLPNQNKISQKSSPKEESKTDKIKKFNSDFPSQKSPESNPNIIEKEKSKEKVNKIPRKVIESTKSTNTIQNQAKNDPKSKSTSSPISDQKIGKFNSDFPTNKKLENEEEQISQKKTTQRPNSKTNSPIKEIEIEIEIESKNDNKIESKRPNKDQIENDVQNSIQKDQQIQSPKTVVRDFTPQNGNAKNSPNFQANSNAPKQPNRNAKKQGSSVKKQELSLNSAEQNKNGQNGSRSSALKIKNIQVEYKSDKSKQEQKPKEASDKQQANSQKNQVSVQQNQNKKQKLNIVLKPKEQKKTEAENEQKEKQKENAPTKQQKERDVALQPKENNKDQTVQQQKEHEKPNENTNTQPKPKKESEKQKSATKRAKENRFCWKESDSPLQEPQKTATTSQPPSTVTTNEGDGFQKPQTAVTLSQNENDKKGPPNDDTNSPKDVIPLNESSTLSEELKKQIKYEVEKASQQSSAVSQHSISPSSAVSKQKPSVFTLKMNIESQPVCIAVGDIEGDVEKLQQIVSFIKSNPTLHFVFIGDIIDDLSDACPTSSSSWDCLNLLSEFFTTTNSTFSLDNTETAKSDTNISLPSSFCDISFREVKYGNIRNRVKFLAGNAECDNLLDFQKPCNIVPGDVTNYIFGQGKWLKTVTFDKMCLLYRYLKSCYGIIKMKKSSPEIKKNSENGFVDTVYFRHSPSSFKVNRFPKNMYFPNPDLKKSDIEKRNFFFITGHARIFASISSTKHDNKEMFYVVDTTVLDAQNQYLKDVGGFGTNDRRLAVVSFDKEVGFSVKAISLPCAFPKSSLTCKISDKFIQIKGI